MRTEYILALVLVAVSLIAGYALRGCVEKPRIETRTVRDTTVIRPDTVRIVAHATRTERVIVRDTLLVPTPTEYTVAILDTTVEAGVDVVRPDGTTRTTLTERILVEYTEGLGVFRLDVAPSPIHIPDSSRVIRETITECPPETWYESALRYALYGLSAVGLVSIATIAR
jgi:hypothetical protein